MRNHWDSGITQELSTAVEMWVNSLCSVAECFPENSSWCQNQQVCQGMSGPTDWILYCIKHTFTFYTILCCLLHTMILHCWCYRCNAPSAGRRSLHHISSTYTTTYSQCSKTAFYNQVFISVIHQILHDNVKTAGENGAERDGARKKCNTR